MEERRRVTLKDVASLASVSPSAASAALRGDGRLHDETRARIVAAADQLGYRRNAVARSLRRSGRGLVVTVMFGMPSDASVRRPQSFWEQAMFGYVRELANAGTGNAFVAADQVELLAVLPADVVFLFNLPQAAADSLSVPDGLPVIRVASATETGEEHDAHAGVVGTVIWDYHAALGAALSHLTEAGARSPGLLLPPKPLMPTALIRQAQDDWCRTHDRPVLRSESPDIADGSRELLDQGCDAFVVHGDQSAGDIDRVVAALRAAGLRIPEDVLLASISDGKRELVLDPPVTSLSYDGISSGAQMARAVITWLETGRFPETSVAWSLDVRASTLR